MQTPTISKKQFKKWFDINETDFFIKNNYADLTIQQIITKLECDADKELADFRESLNDRDRHWFWENSLAIKEDFKRQQNAHSQAYNIIATVYNNIPYQSEFEYIVNQAKMIAIQHSAYFDENDIIKLYHQLSYNDGIYDKYAVYCDFTEADYYHMILHKNISACQAYEKFQERPPLIIQCLLNDYSGQSFDVTKSWDSFRQDKKIKQQRACVGSWFEWDDHIVCITSFSKNSNKLIACAYHPPIKGIYKNKIQKRYTLSMDEIRKRERGC